MQTNQREDLQSYCLPVLVLFYTLFIIQYVIVINGRNMIVLFPAILMCYSRVKYKLVNGPAICVYKIKIHETTIHMFDKLSLTNNSRLKRRCEREN